MVESLYYGILDGGQDFKKTVNKVSGHSFCVVRVVIQLTTLSGNPLGD